MHLYKLESKKMVTTQIEEAITKTKKATEKGLGILQQATEYLYINLHSLFLISIFLTITAIDSTVDAINTKTNKMIHKVLERHLGYSEFRPETERAFDLFASFVTFYSTLLLTTAFIFVEQNLIGNNSSLAQALSFKIAFPMMMGFKGLVQYINLSALAQNEHFSFKHGYELELTVKNIFAKSLNSRLASTNNITLGISGLEIHADASITKLYLLAVEKINKVLRNSNHLQEYLQTNNIKEFNVSVINNYQRAQQRKMWSPAIIKTNSGYLSREELLNIRSQIKATNLNIVKELKLDTIKDIAADHPLFTTSWPLAISLNPIKASYNNINEETDLETILQLVYDKPSITKIELEENAILKDSSYAKLQKLKTTGTLITYKNFTTKELEISHHVEISTLRAAALNYMAGESINLVQRIADLNLAENKNDIDSALLDLTAESRFYLPHVTVTNSAPRESLVKMCELLLRLGADVNYKTTDLILSPLLNATRTYNKDIVSLLLQTKKISYPNLEMAISYIEHNNYQDSNIKSLLLDYRKNNYLYVYKFFGKGYYVSRTNSSNYPFSSLYEKINTYLANVYNYFTSFIPAMNNNFQDMLHSQNIDPIQEKILSMQRHDNTLIFRKLNLGLFCVDNEIEIEENNPAIKMKPRV